VQRGETFGFLGSNGSGKTTTLWALLGIIQADSGTLHFDGRPFTPEDGSQLRYLPEERGLYKKESVLTVMTYFGELKGLSKKAAATWSMNYLERVGLGNGKLTAPESENPRMAEAGMRDRIRGPGLLQIKDLAGAVLRARTRGIEVQLLDDGDMASLSGVYKGEITRQLVQALDGVAHGKVVVRSVTGEAWTVSLFADGGETGDSDVFVRV